MAHELFIDLSSLEKLADEVSKTKQHRTVGLNADVVAVLKPAHSTRKRARRKPTAADITAAWSAFGGWKDEDVDTFLMQNAESRQRSTRPAVEL